MTATAQSDLNAVLKTAAAVGRFPHRLMDTVHGAIHRNPPVRQPVVWADRFSPQISVPWTVNMRYSPRTSLETTNTRTPWPLPSDQLATPDMCYYPTPSHRAASIPYSAFVDTPARSPYSIPDDELLAHQEVARTLERLLFANRAPSARSAAGSTSSPSGPTAILHKLLAGINLDISPFNKHMSAVPDLTEEQVKLAFCVIHATTDLSAVRCVARKGTATFCALGSHRSSGFSSLIAITHTTLWPAPAWETGFRRLR